MRGNDGGDIQRCMNKAAKKVNLHAFGQESCSSESSPALGVMSVVMANDNSSMRRILHSFENICAQSLVRINAE